jgi:nicotinate-nucleotide--dimethylbenzimidazole phosphoribosyltransferase
VAHEIIGFESQLAAVVAAVESPSREAERRAWNRLDSLTKPPRSLGRLEELAARVACIQDDVRPDVARKAIILAAADHGVVAEGVSAYPQDVTWQMVANFSAGGAAINQLAASVGAQVAIFDVGVAAETDHLPGVRQAKVARGTQNMAVGPAMSREECAHAVMIGVDAAQELARGGTRLLGTGEMGIGNSTAAAALTAVYARASVETVVGPGTGLDSDGVSRKSDVVRRALDANSVESLDALGVLAAVGGLEIAMLAGVVIGAAHEGVCVVSDGYISGAATLAAVALCPVAREFVFPSHLSVEPGHAIALDALGLEPVFDLDMRLGEGTGAALAFGIIDASCRMMSGMATFAEAGVDQAAE